jgi:tetratricopeptide (TPR) repeat protein
MGLFDFFKRKSTRPSGFDLRAALISAVEQRDNETLSRLCNENQKAILDAFPTWRTVPAVFRNDPIARDLYCQALVAVASLFEQAGDPSLIAMMIGNQAVNPIYEWKRDLSAAQALIDEGKPDQAVEQLQATLARTNGLRGSGVDHYLPRTFGMLGVALYRAGDTQKAVELTRKAKILSEELGDDEGVQVYVGNLQQMGADETGAAPDMGSM